MANGDSYLFAKAYVIESLYYWDVRRILAHETIRSLPERGHVYFSFPYATQRQLDREVSSFWDLKLLNYFKK